MMSIRIFDNNFGITIVEASTGVVTLGFIQDDENFSIFKTLLYQVKPNEVRIKIKIIYLFIFKTKKKNFLQVVYDQINVPN